MSFIYIFNINLVSQSTVMINADQEGAPISKYLYGQFTEHLGKSIYSGLWSEMILDRKFFFKITDKYDPWGIGQPDGYWGGSTFPYLKASPWKVIGAAGSVTMDSISPYTGKYATVINIAGNEAGICHEALAIVTGKSYQGNILLAGTQEALPIIIRLVSKTGDTIVQKITKIDSIYKYYPLNFASTITTDSAKLEIISSGSGSFKIGVLSLMPSDNIDGWRSDVITLLRELNSPIYRWPGGNFVSGYNWRDGVGERDKRVSRKNPAWTGIEPNDVGIHEFINLMKVINSEPFVAINMGLGSVEDGVAEVEYCNGDTLTTEGKIRAKNGHPESFKVKYWAVGNEMFGNWQLGYMPLKDYEAKHIKAAQGIWKVDSTAKLIGVGDVGSNWSSPMLTVCGDYMNLISEHRYCKNNANLVTHINAIATEIKNVASAHRAYRKSIAGLAAKNIRIALDEYNYWYGLNPYGQLGIIYHQKDGLGVAAAMHELFKNSDLFFMANYAQTINVLGCIKTTATTSAMEATALPLVLYRNHFGEIPLVVTGSTLQLNVSAAYTHAKDSLTIAIVNALSTDVYYKVNLNGAIQKEGFTKWTIANPDPNAYNEPGKEPKIAIVEEKFTSTIDSIKIPAYGLVMVKFPIEKTTSAKSVNGIQYFTNYPNPFKNKSTIEYQVNNKSQVHLNVFDTMGREISSISNGIKDAGIYSETWNASNIENGVYFCKLKVDNISETRKMVLLK
jgi:alpha-N-arabinofuranosidase